MWRLSSCCMHPARGSVTMGVAHVDRSISDQRDSNSPTIVPVGFTVDVPYTTVCITHPPGPFFHDQHLHSWNSVDAKNVGVGNISPRAFRRRMISFGIGTLSVVEQSGVEKRPRGVRYTPAVYGTVYVVHPFKTCLQVSKELLLL